MCSNIINTSIVLLIIIIATLDAVAILHYNILKHSDSMIIHIELEEKRPNANMPGCRGTGPVQWSQNVPFLVKISTEEGVLLKFVGMIQGGCYDTNFSKMLS